MMIAEPLQLQSEDNDALPPMKSEDPLPSKFAPSKPTNRAKNAKKSAKTTITKPAVSSEVSLPEKANKTNPVLAEIDPGLFEVDPNLNRKKRRKKASPEGREDEGSLPSGSPTSRGEKEPKGKTGETSKSTRKPKEVSEIQDEDSAQKTPIDPVITLDPKSPRRGLEIDGQLRDELSDPVEVSLSMPAPEIQLELKDDTSSSSNGGSTSNPFGGIESHSSLTRTTTASCNNGVNTSALSSTTDESKPRKVLRLNPKTGTIGSPPNKKTPQVEIVAQRNQPHRAKTPRSRIVTVAYRSGTKLSSEFGLKIEQILNGTRTAASFLEEESTAPPVTSNKPPKSMRVAGTNTAVAPHPFFLGKAALKSAILPKAKSPSPDVVEIPRPAESADVGRITLRSPNRASPSRPPRNTFVGFGGFNTSARVSKIPGAVEPAWPWKGIVHVRGNAETGRDEPTSSTNFSSLRPGHKRSKYHAVEILAKEDIIGIMAAELCMSDVLKSIQEINLDEYSPLPHCLRSPVKHYESGIKLQQRVRKELKSRLPLPSTSKDDSSSEDEIQGNGSKRAAIHPALTKIYSEIAISLSAYDQSRCETQAWIHKYSPKAAVDVLQSGREAVILKEWLQTLTVISVESGSGDSSARSSILRRSAPSKFEGPTKRKRKSKKLDGFVVSSDEEQDDMDEISDPEEDNSLCRGRDLLQKTVIRAGDASAKGSSRLTNAVVVSGPHGCGKTAAVYAVAKELDFEVFEINSSSRRSGRDILEKVGDMTRNHLVQRSQNQAAAEPVDEDTQRVSDALEDDLKSGRQGTMNTFFKPKEVSKAVPKPKKPPTVKKSEPGKATIPPKAPSKQQKQSLILFEEVDILYEEDKQFWATVMTMIVQSKRPIIMTCTDESALPLAALSLHAIIRLTPPPVDLATDYMLLVAANEGHVLRREAVKTLYEGRHMDLRGSLTELNFWCQFAVGDVKGGLDWLYIRWPSGSDVDDQGNTIRVVSEGTYEPGMGMLSQDILESDANYLDIEEQILHQAWDGWHLDVGDWPNSLNTQAWAKTIQSTSKGPEGNRDALGMYEDFADAMSAADLCSGGAFATDNRVSP
jgi:DNA polymerase III delta prime subunit